MFYQTQIFLEFSLFRFANIFKLNNLSVDNIMNVVKTIKYESSLELNCYQTMLSDDVLLSQVKAVEQKLQIVMTSDQIMDAVQNDKLQKAAELFIYLNTCPDSWFKSWSSFYKDLFLTQSADKIILTLNRIMKTKTSQHEKDGKFAEKLFKRTSKLLFLNFEKIQNLPPEKYFKNGSLENIKISEGRH